MLLHMAEQEGICVNPASLLIRGSVEQQKHTPQGTHEWEKQPVHRQQQQQVEKVPGY